MLITLRHFVWADKKKKKNKFSFYIGPNKQQPRWCRAEGSSTAGAAREYRMTTERQMGCLQSDRFSSGAWLRQDNYSQCYIMKVLSTNNLWDELSLEKHLRRFQICMPQFNLLFINNNNPCSVSQPTPAHYHVVPLKMMIISIQANM